MPEIIDRAGLWKATILDCGVTTTSKRGYPQFIAKFHVTALYNDETEQWDDATGNDFVDIGYFCLVREDKDGKIVKCFNYDQVMEALGWDGESFSGLASGNWKGTEVQIRTQEDNYQDTLKYKISSIAAADAAPGLRKLSAKDAADLDRKFAIARPTPKPASAPKPKAKVKPKAKAKAAPKAVPAEEYPAGQVAMSPHLADDEVEATSPSTTTADAGWQVCEAANKSLGDRADPPEVLQDRWVGAVGDLAADETAPTGEEWAKVRDQVLHDLGIPF